MALRRHRNLLVIAMLLALSLPASGKLFPFTLNEMVANSDFIARATVKDIEDAGKSQSGSSARHKVTISINQLIKGNLPGEIEVNAYPSSIEAAGFKKGEQVLLFLQ